MKIEPKILNNVCITTHPEGCRRETLRQINWTKAHAPVTAGPKRVLIIGSSAGFGLASAIVSSFAVRADTVSVAFEKFPSIKRPGTPGYYNIESYQNQARKEGLVAEHVNGDAFSADVKSEALKLVKEHLKKVDLIIYSLAAPVRVDPLDGKSYRSVLKPIAKTFNSRTLDFNRELITDVSIKPATDDEILATQKVMGGEDWLLWMEALSKEGLLAENSKTVAYSYIGPELTFDIYREGTIGRAKEHLRRTAKDIDQLLAPLGGRAYISVNKALVTRASAVIPVVPLYISILFKIMKEKNIHEACIEQIYRLFSEFLYRADGRAVPLDGEDRIRIDDLEMRSDVQEAVKVAWNSISQTNLTEFADIAGFRDAYLNLHGFAIAGIDYDAEVDPLRD